MFDAEKKSTYICCLLSHKFLSSSSIFLPFRFFIILFLFFLRVYFLFIVLFLFFNSSIFMFFFSIHFKHITFRIVTQLLLPCLLSLSSSLLSTNSFTFLGVQPVFAFFDELPFLAFLPLVPFVMSLFLFITLTFGEPSSCIDLVTRRGVLASSSLNSRCLLAGLFFPISCTKITKYFSKLLYKNRGHSLKHTQA